MIDQTLKKADDRILSFVRKHYRQNLNAPTPYKLHSISTFIAVGLSINSILPFFYNGYDTFGNLFTTFRVVYGLFLIALYIDTYYYWRVFFEFRKEGVVTDKNLFFSESAKLPRKIAFFVALVIDSVHILRSQVIPADLQGTLKKIRFATQAEFIQDAGQIIFYDLIFGIIAVECIRLMYSKSFSWTNAKHFTIVTLITIVFSVVQLFSRYYFSGHGMFW